MCTHVRIYIAFDFAVACGFTFFISFGMGKVLPDWEDCENVQWCAAKTSLLDGKCCSANDGEWKPRQSTLRWYTQTYRIRLRLYTHTLTYRLRHLKDAKNRLPLFLSLSIYIYIYLFIYLFIHMCMYVGIPLGPSHGAEDRWESSSPVFDGRAALPRWLTYIHTCTLL